MEKIMLFLFLTAGFSHVAVQDDVMDQIRPRGWSVSNDELSIQLRIDAASAAPESKLRAKLFVRAFDAEKHAKLLQGRIIYTFVPVKQEPGNETFSTSEHFSGGGADYTGKTSTEYMLIAPVREGKYYLFATVLSTDFDVKAFLMTARVSAGAGPWWIGTMSTPPVPVEVAK